MIDTLATGINGIIASGGLVTEHWNEAGTKTVQLDEVEDLYDDDQGETLAWEITGTRNGYVDIDEDEISDASITATTLKYRTLGGQQYGIYDLSHRWTQMPDCTFSGELTIS